MIFSPGCSGDMEAHIDQYSGSGSQDLDASLAHGNIYLRPVPSDWDEERVEAFFSTFGAIDSVRVSYPTPGTRAGVASGFVRFRDNESAAKALQALQGTLLDGIPVVIKLADADMAPRIQSGQCMSEWCYARGLPAHLGRDDVAALFSSYGQVKDMKYFPSTEFYRGSGALVQYETPEESSHAIQALNGCLLPSATQPLLVRYADSPAEKAAKAARKERITTRSSNFTGAGINPSLMLTPDQIQQQFLELSLKATAQGLGPSTALLGGGGGPAAMLANAQFGDASWLHQQALAGTGGGALPSTARNHGSQGCSIYIKGMPEDADKLWLYEKFARFGGIMSVRVLLDEHTGRCNGIGFVNFTDPEGARAAHETMNGVSMGERLLHVMVQSHGSGRNSGGRPQSSSTMGNNAAATVSPANGMSVSGLNGLQGTSPFIPGGGLSGSLPSLQLQHHQQVHSGENYHDGGGVQGNW